MSARRSILILFLTGILAIGVPLAATEDISVCTADDPRAECSASNAIGDDVEDDCTDDHEECRGWSKIGECDKNPAYMFVSCRRSCRVCQNESDKIDFGVDQLIPAHLELPVKQIIANSIEYMQNVVNVDPKYESVRHECRNTEAHCSEWAIGTGCDDNPKYMKQECAPACKSCDYVLDMKTKCTPDPEGKDAIEAGEMDALFKRMIRKAESENMQPTVLSRPNPKNGEPTTPCEGDIANPCNAQIGPWVLTLENFITPEEISSLLSWGSKMGYERSQAGDEIVSARTSAHAWCVDDCMEDPIVTKVRQRIVDVTGISENNYECLQLLKYQPGQYYKPHNDFIEKHVRLSPGPRLLTFFIYFNEVEKGGGTRFPKLNGLTVEPKQGRVLIWPSVLDENLYMEDTQTMHEAMAVEAGEKYAANAWIHTKDFQTPFKLGCPS